MAKDLQWFKFFISEYMAGDIIFCSDAAQGVFTRLCCIYWARECSLTEKQLSRHFEGKNQLINELIKDNIIKIKDGQIHINFLDEQKAKWIELSPIKSHAGKQGGRGNKSTDKADVKQNESKTKANVNQDLKQNKAIEKRKDEDFSPEGGNKSESLYVPTDQNHTLGLVGPASDLVKSEKEIKKREDFLAQISANKYRADDMLTMLEIWDDLLPENVNAFYVPFRRDYYTEANAHKKPSANEIIERLRVIQKKQYDES